MWPQQQGYFPGGPPPPQFANPYGVQQKSWQPVNPNAMKSQEIIAKAQYTGGKYEDPEFPASQQSIGGKKVEGIIWKRPHEICSNPQLFVDGVSSGDVIQGALGDCWFLGALAVVATRIDLIKEIIVSTNPQHGFYQFRFYKNGEWNVVTIDDRIPCKRVNSGYKIIFAHCKEHNEMWVPLI